MKLQYATKGSVKKISTQASKGGSIVITIEVPLTEDNAMLCATQNRDCAVHLSFDAESIDEVQGQGKLPFADVEEPGFDEEE